MDADKKINPREFQIGELSVAKVATLLPVFSDK
jgi:hypothetical protein